MSVTYAALRVNESDGAQLSAYIAAHNIPKRTLLDQQDWHVSLFHSDNELIFPVASEQYVATVLCASTLPSRHGHDCLVLLLDCPELCARQHHLVSTLGVKTRFNSYIPHLTLSYDISGFDWAALPLPLRQITLHDEYVRMSHSHQDLSCNIQNSQNGNRSATG